MASQTKQLQSRNQHQKLTKLISTLSLFLPSYHIPHLTFSPMELISLLHSNSSIDIPADSFLTFFQWRQIWMKHCFCGCQSLLMVVSKPMKNIVKKNLEMIKRNEKKITSTVYPPDPALLLRSNDDSPW
jgi:hypothetical protein